MPVVRRQKPTESAVPDLAPGSLLAEAVSTSALKESDAKVCIYGRNRSGKTTLACQFPKPLLLISAEPDACGGATSVVDVPGVRLQRISHTMLGQDNRGQWVEADNPSCARKDTVKGSAKLLAMAGELRGKHPFKTVVLDTATSLQDLILVELMGWTNTPTVQHIGMVGKETYQYRAEKWREVVRAIIDLRGVHVVILAQEKDHNPSTDDFGGKRKILGTMQSGSFMAPALGATNAQWVQDTCGYVVHLYEDELMEEVSVPALDANGQAITSVQKVSTGKRQRHLRLLYHPNYAAGGRWTYSRETPEFVTARGPQELYQQLKKFIPALV